MENNLTIRHLILLAIMLAVFTFLSYLMTNAGIDDGPGHNKAVVFACLGTITGPLVGAVARGFQRCCLRFSLAVMAYCGPILLGGVLVQFIHLPDTRKASAIRMAAWITGWLVWFLGGILSFGHALS